MSKNLILSTLLLFAFCWSVQAQTVDELKAKKTAKEEQLAALQAEVADIDKQLLEFPGWRYGGVGTIGFNALANNNWFALGTPNSRNDALGLGLAGFANLNEDKYFWRSLLNVNVSRSAAWSDKDNDATKAIALTNGLDLTSLFGYKLSDKLAVSAEAKWISSIIEFDDNGTSDNFIDDKYPIRFNAPGQLTVSAGVTWTPITNLVVLIHPLGYQKNWPGDLISSAGAKIGATYAAEIIKGVSWTSNLSAFVPYSNGDGMVDIKNIAEDAVLRTVPYETGNLVNWTWINGFSFSVWKGIGVSFNLGLRGDQQVADLGRVRIANSEGLDVSTLDISDNPLQSYYTLGLAYTF